MADGNTAFTLPTAIRVGRGLERIGLDWFEEPAPQLLPSEAEYAGYDTLAAQLDIPITCGAILESHGAFKGLLDGRKVDTIQSDVTICGGIAECLFVSDLARLQGVQSNPHCWGGAIAIAATVHVLSLPANSTGGPSTETPMLEHDMTPNSFLIALQVEALEVKGGSIAVPASPSLGGVDEDVLRCYQVA
jgi:D-galactarolactone cycloisomerase